MDVVAYILALVAGTGRSIITEAIHFTKVLGYLMLNLAEEADRSKGMDKEKRAEFELMIWELKYNVV